MVCGDTTTIIFPKCEIYTLSIDSLVLGGIANSANHFTEYISISCSLIFWGVDTPMAKVFHFQNNPVSKIQTLCVPWSTICLTSYLKRI